MRERRAGTISLLWQIPKQARASQTLRRNLLRKKKSITYNVLQVEPVVNYIVAWTISPGPIIGTFATLYGHKPSEFTDCLKEMLSFLPGDETFIYFHNLSYDWGFLDRFLIKEFGEAGTST